MVANKRNSRGCELNVDDAIICMYKNLSGLFSPTSMVARQRIYLGCELIDGDAKICMYKILGGLC